MADTLDPANLDAVFKAYDVRGVVPDQIDERLARAIGRAFVEVVRRPPWWSGTTCGRARPAWPAPSPTGASEAGADVVMVGLASTDQLYFASGHLDHPGVMFTASHNPAQYNGIKMCRAGAQPVGMETGLAEIRDAVAGRRDGRRRAAGHDHRARRARGVRRPPAAARTGARPAAQGRGRRRQRHGRAHRARRLRPARGGPGRAGADVLRARRHLPQPRGQPDRPRQPRRPPAAGARRGRRPRPRLRRRRRPLLPRRRARPGGLAVHADRADRLPRAGQGAGRRGDPQPDHEPRRRPSS